MGREMYRNQSLANSFQGAIAVKELAGYVDER